MRILSLFLFLFISPMICFSALSKLYPTSAVTTVRLDAYNDGFKTVYMSTWTIDFSTWVPLGSTWTWIVPEGNVQVFTLDTSTPIVHSSTWSLRDYTDRVIKETELRMINLIVDEAIEQYMVDSSTEPYPNPGTWKGWCWILMNNKWVYGTCP